MYQYKDDSYGFGAILTVHFQAKLIKLSDYHGKAGIVGNMPAGIVPCEQKRFLLLWTALVN